MTGDFRESDYNIFTSQSVSNILLTYQSVRDKRHHISSDEALLVHPLVPISPVLDY